MELRWQEILRYVNLAREYPKYYVGLIEEQLAAFVDDVSMQLQKDVLYETIEGKKAWEEARTFLNAQEPLRPFDYHDGLAKAAADHAKDIIKNSSHGHVGSDGSSFIDRVQRYCRKGKGSMVELLGTTHAIPQKNNIQMALVNLIVDDGVANRGHRRALFSKDYKYIGADCLEADGQVYSVIALTQANLELIQAEPQSIATSTSHLNTLTHIAPARNTQTVLNSRENCIDAVTSPQKQAKSSKFVGSGEKIKQDSVWTLKNVSEGKGQSKKRVNEEKGGETLYAEPSIFKEANQSLSSASHIYPKSQKEAQSKISITSPNKLPPQTPKDPSKGIKNGVGSQAHIKQSNISLKNSQHSIHSDAKGKSATSQGFGVSSQVQRFKLKSTLQSPFMKGNTFGSTFGSNGGQKKVVEKKETMRSWCEDEFMVREVTTVLKYEDGTFEDFVQKHSVLRNPDSVIKEQAV